MNRSKHLALALAATTGISLLAGTSAFADSRHQDGTWRNESDRSDNHSGSYRDHERVNIEGRVTSVNRDRDGYRVQLDRDRTSYWVPARALRNRGNDLRIGLSVRLGGIFSGGYVTVDAYDPIVVAGRYDDRRYDDRRGYELRSLRGIVERVDYRRDALVVREESSGRLVTIDMFRADGRRGGIDLNDLHRGDRIQLSGEWTRNGLFRASRIEGIRTGRW